MRAIYLIALREFAENAKTKGFWIGLLLFPVMIYGSIYAQKFLESSTPTRNYVLVDQSGEYADVIRAAMEEDHRDDVLDALMGYWGQHSTEKQNSAPQAPSAEDMENTSLDRMAAIAKKANEAMKAILGPILERDGLEGVMAHMAPQLVEDRPDFEEPKRKFREVRLPEDVQADLAMADLSDGLRPYLTGRDIQVDGAGEDLFAAILIPKDVANAVEGKSGLADLMSLSEEAKEMQADPDAAPVRVGIQYWGVNLADSDLLNNVKWAVNAELRRKAFEERELDTKLVAEVQALKVRIQSLNPEKEVGKEEVSTADKVRQWAPVGFVYLLWIAIFTVSQMLLNNTIEEKSNRIIEVLLSSVTAGELMMGKLAGIAAVGLTMIGVWMGSLALILKLNSGPESEIASVLWEVLQTSGLIPIFMMYFILGYLLYSAIFLSIGSMCNTLKEAQNLMGPVMLIMMVPMVTMMFIPKDPNGTLARVLSWIPLYTPFTMMNRAAANPPMVDWVGTGVLLVASTALAMFLAGRIFRAGILRTGQPPKFKELLGWLRTS